MMKSRIFFLGLALVLIGCDDGGGNGGDPALTGTVTITGINALNETLTANTASLAGSGDISYKWEQADTVDGTYAAITGATNSTYIVTDTGKYIRVSVTRAGYSGSISSGAVRIYADTASIPNVTGVTVDPSTATVAKGETKQFSATVAGDPSNEVSWTVDGSASSITADGKLTVGTGETKTTLTVTATSVANSAKKAAAAVTVTVPSGGINSTLNGTWVGNWVVISVTEYPDGKREETQKIIGTQKMTLDNGNFEVSVESSDYTGAVYKGTYTTDNGKITMKITHVYGLFLDYGLDARWYSKTELRAALVPSKMTQTEFNRDFGEGEGFGGHTDTYSVTNTTLIMTSENGGAQTFTKEISGGTDSALNGTWVSKDEIIGTQKMTLDNGNIEVSLNDQPNTKWTYTTGSGKITMKATHLYGKALLGLGLDAKWYSKTELQTALVPSKMTQAEFNKSFEEGFEGSTYTYSVTTTTLTITDEDGDVTTFTRQ